MTAYSNQTDEEIFEQFCQDCATVASIQGRIAYLVMSLNAVNPCILSSVCSERPMKLLYTNMVYGIGLLIYARPNMRPIGTFNRIVFSFLGSLMFNYSSMAVFTSIRDKFSDRPALATILGFLAGRFMMLHLLAFLYHVDMSRYMRDRNAPRNPDFDSMYT